MTPSPIPPAESAAWAAARAQAMENPGLWLERAEKSLGEPDDRARFWYDQSLKRDSLEDVERGGSRAYVAARHFLAACEHLTRAASYEPRVTPDAYRKAIREWSRNGEEAQT